MVVSKIYNPRFELHIGDVKIKQVQKSNYVGHVVMENVTQKYEGE